MWVISEADEDLSSVFSKSRLTAFIGDCNAGNKAPEGHEQGDGLPTIHSGTDPMVLRLLRSLGTIPLSNGYGPIDVSADVPVAKGLQKLRQHCLPNRAFTEAGVLRGCVPDFLQECMHGDGYAIMRKHGEQSPTLHVFRYPHRFSLS